MYRNFLIVTGVAAALAQAAPSARPEAQHISYNTAVDTAWVDQPRPILTTQAIKELVELWSKHRFRGACLHGEVQQRVGLGKVAYVERVSSAAFPDRCTGFTYVGAVVFLHEGARDPEWASACDLLEGHPEWGTAGTISGLVRQTLRDPDGRVLGNAMAPEALFCGWVSDGRDSSVVTATAST